MKQLVKINAQNVKSRFGYIMEEFGGAAMIKVACDEMQCLTENHCILLGSDFYEKI